LVFTHCVSPDEDGWGCDNARGSGVQAAGWRQAVHCISCELLNNGTSDTGGRAVSAKEDSGTHLFSYASRIITHYVAGSL